MAKNLTSISLDEVVTISTDAIKWAISNGYTPSQKNFRIALRQLNAPFNSETFMLKITGLKTYNEFLNTYCFELLSNGKRNSVADIAVRQQQQQIAQSGLISGDKIRSIVIESNIEAERESMDDLWRSVTEAADTTVKNIKAIRNSTVEIHTDKPFGVILVGDAHFGSHAVDYQRLKWITDVANDIQYVGIISVGDVLDQMIWNKVSVSVGRLSNMDVPTEIKLGADWIKRIAKTKYGNKWIAICAGNHDLVSLKMTGWSALDTALAIVGEKIIYNQYQVNLTIKINGQSYTVVVRHKVRGSSQYNPAHGAAKWMRWEPDLDADAIVVGHTHRSGYQELSLHGKRRHAIQLGAYKIWDADEFAVEQDLTNENLHPDMLMIIHPDKHLMEVHTDTMRGLEYLKQLNG